MTPALLLALKLSVVVLLLAIGLGSTPADITYLWRRPSQLLRALVAMYVAVPLAALLAVRTLPLPVAVKTAILVLAISAGAPLLPRKLMKLGREGYVFSLLITSSVLAVAVVPAWLSVLGPLFDRESSVEPRAVALVIAKAFLAPLLVGMLLRWPLPSVVADRLSEWLLGAAGAVLTLAGAALLVLHGRALVEVGWLPILALTGMTAIAVAIGHAIGRPGPRGSHRPGRFLRDPARRDRHARGLDGAGSADRRLRPRVRRRFGGRLHSLPEVARARRPASLSSSVPGGARDPLSASRTRRRRSAAASAWK